MPLYFIAILPPPEITEQVRSIQNEFANNYGSKKQLRLPVHLTLVPPFKRAAGFEEKMIPSLEEFTKKQHGFEMHLEDFGAFGKRVIFIAIRENEKLGQLHQDLNSWLKAKLHFEESESEKRFHPHVTVANKDLTLPAFKKAWPELKQRKFSASFQAMGIHLLKHNGSLWEAFREFQFG